MLSVRFSSGKLLQRFRLDHKKSEFKARNIIWRKKRNATGNSSRRSWLNNKPYEQQLKFGEWEKCPNQISCIRQFKRILKLGGTVVFEDLAWGGGGGGGGGGDGLKYVSPPLRWFRKPQT